MIATGTPSVEEFLQGGDNERSEYAQGENWEKPPANKKHASVQVRLGSALTKYGHQGGNGEAFSGWHHRFGPEDDTRIDVPQIVFVRGAKLAASTYTRRTGLRVDFEKTIH
jgi:Uma2 family endonuclease